MVLRQPTIMFIGEAPGWHENQQGRPFVGPAGQFLDELLGVDQPEARTMSTSPT